MSTKLPRANQRDGKRILVVDDEPRMIGFIRMNLELEGRLGLRDRGERLRNRHRRLSLR